MTKEAGPEAKTPEKVLTPQEFFSQALKQLSEIELGLLRAEEEGPEAIEKYSKRFAISYLPLLTVVEYSAPQVGYGPIETWQLVLGHANFVAERGRNTELGKEARATGRRMEEFLSSLHGGLKDKTLFDLQAKLRHLAIMAEIPAATIIDTERAALLIEDLRNIETAALSLGLTNPTFYRQLVEKIAAIQEGSGTAKKSRELAQLQKIYLGIAEGQQPKER